MVSFYSNESSNVFGPTIKLSITNGLVYFFVSFPFFRYFRVSTINSLYLHIMQRHWLHIKSAEPGARNTATPNRLFREWKRFPVDGREQETVFFCTLSFCFFLFTSSLNLVRCLSLSFLRNRKIKRSGAVARLFGKIRFDHRRVTTSPRPRAVIVTKDQTEHSAHHRV